MQTIDHIAICSPNNLHDAHAHFALLRHANVICRIPLSWIRPTSGHDRSSRRNTPVRPTPSRNWGDSRTSPRSSKAWLARRRFMTFELSYFAPREHRYDMSRKGDVKKSLGIATNIVAHLFARGSPQRAPTPIRSAPEYLALKLEPGENLIMFRSCDCSDRRARSIASGPSRPSEESDRFHECLVNAEDPSHRLDHQYPAHCRRRLRLLLEGVASTSRSESMCV